MSIFDQQDLGVNAEKVGEFALSECSFTEDYPGLWEFLSRAEFQGKPRYPGKLVLFEDGGKATLCLICKTSGKVAFHTADQVDECLREANQALLDGSMKWRKDKKASYRR